MISIAEVTASTITVVVPIKIRRRNGRARIVWPDGDCRDPDTSSNGASGSTIRAIARAWDWRQRLETGEVTTLQDLANAEKVKLGFVSRFICLAYLSPVVLDRILAKRECVTVSLISLAATARENWAGQPALLFDFLPKSNPDWVS